MGDMTIMDAMAVSRSDDNPVSVGIRMMSHALPWPHPAIWCLGSSALPRGPMDSPIIASKKASLAVRLHPKGEFRATCMGSFTGPLMLSACHYTRI